MNFLSVNTRHLSHAAVDFYGNTGGGGYLTGGSPFGSTSGSPGGLGRVRSGYPTFYFPSLTFFIAGHSFAVHSTHYCETILPSHTSSPGCGLDARKYGVRPCALFIWVPSILFLNASAQVTLVGHIVSVQKQATNCVYKLSDGTGALEVRHWSDSISQDDGDDEDEVK